MRAIALSVFGLQLVIVCVPFVSQAEGQEPSLVLTPVNRDARPGLGSVVLLEVENRGETPIEVVDVERLAFLVVDWVWRWEWEERGVARSYTLTHDDVAFEFSQLLPVEPVAIPPREKRAWIVVVPVPHILVGQRTARLVAVHAPRKGVRLEGQAELAILEPLRFDEAKPLDTHFVHAAIATGMESQVQGFFKRMGVEEEIKRLGFGGGQPLLLAWFCARLYRNEFESEAWIKLSRATHDVRAIRDANLYRALRRGKIRLTSAQAESIKVGVAGAYPFSDAMIEAAQKCVP